MRARRRSDAMRCLAVPHKPYGPRRGVGLVRAVLLVLIVMMAGCASLQQGPFTTGSPVDALPDQWRVAATGCFTSTSFFLVEPSQANPYLPQGFHAGDLSEFLYDTPVTSSKVPAFVATSTCSRFNMTADDRPDACTTYGIGTGTDGRCEGALEVAYLGFFIEAPQFRSAYANEPADFNFYVVAFLTPLGDAPEHLQVSSNVAALYGWNQQDARIQVSVENHTRPAPSGHPAINDLAEGRPVPNHADALSSRGSVELQGANAFAFEAHAFFPQPFETAPSLRFWQEGSSGIGFMEFALPSKTVMAGPIEACAIAPGTIIHEVIGPRQEDHGDTPCGLLDSFALVFDEHELTGYLHQITGVAAA